jgi:hypothetical protein
MIRSASRRVSTMPMTVLPFFAGMSVAGLYFGVSTIIELVTGSRLPLAPSVPIALSVMVANALISFCIFRAIGWIRPFVAIVPLVAYAFEYGNPAALSFSVQSAELVASFLAIPLLSIYCLYMSQSGKDWFAKAWPYEL